MTPELLEAMLAKVNLAQQEDEARMEVLKAKVAQEKADAEAKAKAEFDKQPKDDGEWATVEHGTLQSGLVAEPAASTCKYYTCLLYTSPSPRD